MLYMKVLVVMNTIPYPMENGQNLRIYNYVRLLCRRYEFDLIAQWTDEVPNEIKNIFNSIYTVEFPTAGETVHKGIKRWLASFSVNQMIVRNEHYSEIMDSLLKERLYDVVWIAGENVMASVPVNIGTPILADLVDDSVLPHLRKLRNSKGLKEFVRYAKRAFMAYRFEKKYFSSVDQCWVVSEVDAKAFSRVCRKTPVTVISNGVDDQLFQPIDAPSDPNSIVFEGNMSFEPNISAVVHFCHNILPLILKKNPLVKLTIVGKDPDADVQALISDSVEVTGFVDDVRPYLARASVFVSPMLTGAGIKNKILQAWSMAKPVVATSLSTGGLCAESGKNIVIADSNEAFSSAVLTLISDEALRRSIGEEARKTIKNSFTWERKADELDGLLHYVAGKRN